jgi:hypothetical protein
MNMTTPARLVPVIESHGFMVDTTTGECIERNIDVDQRMNSCPKAPHTDLLEFQPHVIVLNGNPVCHNTNYVEERERDMWQCISRTCNALQIESKKLHQRAFFITRHVMPWQTGSMQAFVAIVIFKLLNELVYTHMIRFKNRCRHAGFRFPRKHVMLHYLHLISPYCQRPASWIPRARLLRRLGYTYYQISEMIHIDQSAVYKNI